MTELVIGDLTSATLDGQGVFDVLMRANKEHLDSEFNKNRIKGAEYSTVYLGSLTQVMSTALQFVLSKEKINLESQLLQQQILLAQIEVIKASAAVKQLEAQTLLVEQQIKNAAAELVIIQANALKVPAEIAQIESQTLQVKQATANLISQKVQIENQSSLIKQQELNAVIEATVLVATECKLRAEYDLLVSNTIKSAQEVTLLAQKVATEKAQVTAMGVDDDSVLGKQKRLYQAQTDGFTRDAEQKAAKVMVDSWNVRRTTDPDSAPADSTNGLNDAAVGRAVNKLLTGVNA